VHLRRFFERSGFGVLAALLLAACQGGGAGTPSFDTGVAPLARTRVVASVTVTLPSTHAGTAFSGPITVQAFDRFGLLIVGAAPYANPFTLTDGDASAHTSLTVGAVTAKTVTVATPNDVVILNYDGAAVAPYTVTATIPPG
jgi:hypothetical protein